MNLEQEIIKRYTDTEKIKEGYYLRIRNEKGILNIKVYYHGIKMMEWNKKGLTINTAVFVPNGSNVFEGKTLLEQYRKIPKTVKEDMDAIEEYFEFSIGSAAKGEARKGKKLNIDFSTGKLHHTPNELLNSIVQDLKNDNIISYFTDIMLNESENRVLLFLRKTNFSLTELYPFMLPLLETTLSNPELQKVDIDVKSQLRQKVEINFEVIEKIMERRIEVYITEDKNRKNDYRNSKSENNQEKQKQQDFMVLLNQNSKKDIFYRNKDDKDELLYSKKTYPFELEYTIYAGIDKKETIHKEEWRSESNVQGRIDNVVLDGNRLHLVEIKYGTGVIAESNGIHKHLIDLYSCLNISKDVILREFKERIETRNQVLTGNKVEIQIDNIEYDIVCIYHTMKEDATLSKEAVMKKLHDIYGRCAIDKVVNCSIDNSKIIDVKPEQNRNANKYSRELLNKNIIELCELLKTKGCTVRILLVDDEFHCFEEYQNNSSNYKC